MRSCAKHRRPGTCGNAPGSISRRFYHAAFLEKQKSVKLLKSLAFPIWPNQQKVLGLVEASDAEKAKAKKIALLASRINTVLSIPMLLFMGAAHHPGLTM